jgi:UDP-N-acetylglucosamine acyltransferase
MSKKAKALSGATPAPLRAPAIVSTPQIHASAVIEPGAVVGKGVKIGPFCHIGANVVLGDGSDLKSHVVVAGRTTIGARTTIFPFAALGHQPQDLKYRGEPSTLTIGDDCIIREGVVIHPGTEGGGMKTVIGNRCAFLGNSHIGHDCIIGDNVIFSHAAMAAGHCVISDYAIISGGAAVIQYARIGQHAFVGAMSGLENDLIPYGMAVGNRAHLQGLNIIGLKRRGFAQSEIHMLRRAYRLLFAAEGTLMERVQDVGAEFEGVASVHEILEFIRAGTSSKRSLCTPRDTAREPAAA